MLKRFEVENFKGFKDRLVFDLTARDYEFNKDLVKDGIVNKGIIYGKNGIGKSNFGLALFDITLHLTDRNRFPSQSFFDYLNLDSSKDSAEFKYVFQFDKDEITYSYHKKGPVYLIDEKLLINNELVIYYNYFDKEKNFLDKRLIGDLRIELINNKLSILKYIYRNTPILSDSPLHKMMSFIDKMFWCRGTTNIDANYLFPTYFSDILEELYASSKKDDLQEFLKENELNYNLQRNNNNDTHELLVVFPSGKKAKFLSIASPGTKSLFLFFYWSVMTFSYISFLFVDEFDAFLHYESAENIVLRLNKNRNFQSFLTSHNTYLMQNKLTRPDCCFIMTENRVSSLFNCTSKEIRQAHNLEKMYINGAFNE